MSDFERYSDTFGNDGKPWTSHTVRYLLGLNLIQVMDEGPGSFGWRYLVGDEPTSAESDYTEDSTLVRFGVEYARPSRKGNRPRWWKVRIGVAVSGGATAALRVTSSGLHACADPPDAPDVEGEVTGVTQASEDWEELTLQLERGNMSVNSYGLPEGDPGGPLSTSDVFWMAIQGRIISGAGTITLYTVSGYEDVPT